MNQFLFSPTKQFIYPSGKILVGGKIYVFIKHTNTLATLYNDEGVEIANPVVLDSNGRATVLADENYDYKLDVYTSDGELLFTAASYMTDQYERDIAIISTDGSVDITPSVSGYTDVWDLSVSSEIQNQINEFRTNEFEPAITGLSGAVDYVSATFDSFTGSIPSFDDKLDTTAFTDFTANNYEPTITDIKGGINEISSFVSDCCSSLPNTYVPYSATTITTASTAQLVDSDTVQTMIDQSTSAIDTFSGVSADSTLTGNGKTSALGVNMLMLTGMLDNAKNEAVASAQSGLIRDIDFMLQNVVIYPDTMSGYNDDGTVWLKYHWGCEGSTEASGNELDNYYEGSIRTNYISMAPSAKEVFDAVRTNSASWSQGTTYSSVSGTVIVSGNDLEISSPAIKTGVPWEVGGWSHSYDDSTAFNAGFPKNYNSYRLEHIMTNRQYPNPAHTGFSAELRQLDENYNILSSTMLYGIFDFEFTPVPNCDMIWLYCSGTSAECQRGVTDYYRTGNHTQWLENLAWENDTPTRNEFANLYENIAVNSGAWNEASAGNVEVNNVVETNSAHWNNSYTALTSTSGDWNDVYGTVLANSASWSASVLDSYTLSAGNNIQINKDDVNSAIGIAVTGLSNYQTTAGMVDYQTTGAMTGYATTGDVANKLDTTAFSTVSGTFLTAHQDISATEWNSVYETVESNSASWAGGSTYTGDAQGALDEVYSNSGNWNNVYTTVYNNSGAWTGGSIDPSQLTAYVPYSATNLAIGYSNDAYQNSFSQGNSNEASQISFAQGDDNISQWESLTQGTSNITYYRSFAQGFCNSAGGTSLAQGNWNSAYGNSFAQGNWNVAERTSFAQGDSNSAYNVSQAFGAGNIITDTGMVIGTFNKTSSDASFVIGNGSSVYDEDLQVDIITRSDSFIIYHDGSVSAMGKISANGVELGAGYTPTYHGIEI